MGRREGPGDDAGRARAVAALATARRWKVLLAMRSEGAYRDVLLQYAAAVAGGGTVTGGKVLSVEESYRAALGCD